MFKFASYIIRLTGLVNKLYIFEISYIKWDIFKEFRKFRENETYFLFLKMAVILKLLLFFFNNNIKLLNYFNGLQST